MTAKELIDNYKTARKINKISDVKDFKGYAERVFRKRMPRPLFISVGKGGGQTYKTLWEVFDSRFNNNTPSYFYNENKKTIDELIASGHKELQEWIDDVSPHLTF